MGKTLGVLIVASAIYGYTVGAAHDQIYATRNLLKFPLLVLSTTIVCSLAYWVLARFFFLRLSFGRVQMLSLALFRDASVLLASLAPVNFFLAQVLVHTDDGRLGEYSLFLGLNVFFVALCGTVALVRQGRSVLATKITSRRRVSAVVLSWLVLSLVVGGQASFYLRPLFGLPASRGNIPPFALGSTPDVRGATNFFEAVLQVFTAPPLPRSWGGSED
ncbi:MAG: hypothetical protein AB1726_04020 [Planctomycetota bacterium]